jgi:hypothetical protein
MLQCEHKDYFNFAQEEIQEVVGDGVYQKVKTGSAEEWDQLLESATHHILKQEENQVDVVIRSRLKLKSNGTLRGKELQAAVHKELKEYILRYYVSKARYLTARTARLRTKDMVLPQGVATDAVQMIMKALPDIYTKINTILKRSGEGIYDLHMYTYDLQQGIQDLSNGISDKMQVG